MKKELRRLARVRKRRPADAARYQELRREYQRAMQKACKDSFRKFCSSASSVKELSGMVKALSTPPSFSALIADPQGNAPITHSQSHLNLLNHHFPAHENTPVQVLADPLPQDLEEDPIMELLTPSIVRNALRSFGPKKAAGPDGLRPNVLRSLGWEAIGLLTEIYRESISTAVIPRSFLHMSVSFIPKKKPDKSSPKSFRPITLASFLLKGLERIVQWHFNETILQNLLSNQHAYTKGRSCDSALSEVVNKMERG